MLTRGGNGFSAGRWSCADSVARLPFAFAQSGADPALHYVNAHLRRGFVPGSQHRHEHGGGMHCTAARVVNRDRGPGVIDEHLLAGAVPLPQHQVEIFQPSPEEIAEAAVAVNVRMVSLI